MKMPKLFGIFQLLFHPVDSSDTLFQKPSSDKEMKAAQKKDEEYIATSIMMEDRGD